MKIVPSLLVESMHGSYSGGVIRRSRYGLVGQKKASIPKRGHNGQNQIRSNFQKSAYEWRQLTSEQKADWNNWAEIYPIYSKKNEENFVSGYNFYMHASANVKLVSPSNPAVTSYVAFSGSLIAGAVTTPGGNQLELQSSFSGNQVSTRSYAGLVILPYQGAPIFNNGILNANVVSAYPTNANHLFSDLNANLISEKRYAIIQKLINPNGGCSPWFFWKMS